MKPSLSIAVPSKKVTDPDAVARFADESVIPRLGATDENTPVTQSPAVTGAATPSKNVLNAAEDAKHEATVIFKMLQRDRDLLDAVFTKSSYKSRRAMFEAEFVPRLKEMAKDLGVAV
jgi:hypothetical protein